MLMIGVPWGVWGCGPDRKDWEPNYRLGQTPREQYEANITGGYECNGETADMIRAEIALEGERDK